MLYGISKPILDFISLNSNPDDREKDHPDQSGQLVMI